MTTVAVPIEKMRKIVPFLRSDARYDFGDYILFQEYIYSWEKSKWCISRPILCIYLGCFVADQTVGFDYVKWSNHRHWVAVSNERGTHRYNKRVESISEHIEWDDYIDILGHWKVKPKWKEILAAYRNYNTKSEMLTDEIDY